MTDLEIEQLIDSAVINFITFYGVFTVQPSNSKIAAEWNSKSNAWKCDIPNDPLSCVVMFNNIEPYKQGYEDVTLATLATYFNRNIGWVESFHCGWLGQPNSSTSIKGYLLGRKFRNRYITV